MRIHLLCLVLLAGLAAAAADPEGWLIPFGAAYHPDVAGFNGQFGAAGLPRARARHYGWGLEVRSLAGNWLIGPLYFRTWDDVENDDYHLRTEATGIMGEVGFKLGFGSNFTVVPMFGLGGLSQSYSIRELTGTLTLDSLLRAPGRVASISSGMKLAGMAALELSLAANTGSGRYGIALRGGYMYSPLDVGWRLANGAEITGVPGSRLGGLFVSAGLLLLPAPQVSGGAP